MKTTRFSLTSARIATWVAAIGCLALAALQSQQADPPAPLFDGRRLHGAVVRDFHLALEGAPTGTDSHSYTAVCQIHDDYPSFLWGTYIGGDRFTGRLLSTPFVLSRPYLYIPVVGFPRLPGNRLSLEVSNRTGSTTRIDCPVDNPGVQLGLWKQNVSPWQGCTARLVLEDGLTATDGWLGVGAPILSHSAKGTYAESAFSPRRVEAWAALAALVVFLLLCALP